MQVEETSLPKLYVVVSIYSKGEIHSMLFETILGSGFEITSIKINPRMNMAQKIVM